MAVTRVTRAVNACVMSDTADGKFEVSDAWKIYLDDPAGGAWEAGGAWAADVSDRPPRERSQYVTVSGIGLPAYCKSRTIRPLDPKVIPGTAFLLEAKFDNETSPIEDPLSRPPVISYGFGKYTKVWEEDADGKAIMNSAKQIFDPPLEEDDDRPIVTFVRNEAEFPFLLAVEYERAVNSDGWWGLDPGQAKIQSITGQPQKENDVEFYQVTYELELKRDGWDRKALDRGWAYRDANGKLQVIKDDDLYPSPTAVNLDGKGGLLEDGDEAVFLEFKVRKLPFARLKLRK